MKKRLLLLCMSVMFASLSSIAQTVDVTFRVDMSSETVDAAGVHIVGTLNGWNTSATMLTDEGSGIYAVTLSLTSGDYHEFKYINGDAWGKEETPGSVCSQSTNRYVFVPYSGDVDLITVDFGGCAPDGVDVTFQVDMSGESVSADGVHLVGFMTGWDPAKLALADQGGGIYAVTKQFQEGESLEFKYINGNAWGGDETPGVPCSTSTNRVLDVPASSVSLDPVDFGGCSFDYISYSGTWSGTPTSTDHVSIEADYTGDPFACDDLYIADGSSLTVSNTGSEVLELDGDLVNDGTLIVSSGAGLVNSGSITGDGTYEVHRNTTFDVSTGQYSFVGSPVASAEVGDLGSLVYAYDETEPYGDNQGLDQWTKLTSGSLTIGQGYASAYTGDIMFSGTPNSGTITVDVTKTMDADATSDEGFNLVANPYPSSITYTAFMTENMYDASTNPSGTVSGTIYIWDDESSETVRDESDYLTISAAGVVGGSPKNSKTWSGSIGSVQGFFVKVDDSKAAGSYSIGFTDAMRNASNSDDHFFRQTTELKTARVWLKKTDEDYSKDILLAFGDQATLAVDNQFDAQLFGASDMQFFSLIESERYVINALPMSFQAVALGAKLPETGTYELSVSEASNGLEGLMLLDQETGQTLTLVADQKMTFSAGQGEIMDRFTLVSPEEILSSRLGTEMELMVKDQKVHVSLGDTFEGKLLDMAIYNLSGKLLEQKKGINRQETISFDYAVSENQIYLIKVATEADTYTAKLMIK